MYTLIEMYSICFSILTYLFKFTDTLLPFFILMKTCITSQRKQKMVASVTTSIFCFSPYLHCMFEDFGKTGQICAPFYPIAFTVYCTFAPATSFSCLLVLAWQTPMNVISPYFVHKCFS
jgi:hypothetical protein